MLCVESRAVRRRPNPTLMATMDDEDRQARAGVVYVVDDDASVCRALARLLRSYGLRSRTFGSARDLLNDDWHRAGCFLIDIRMPLIGGFELADRLAAAGSTVPVVFMSAHAEISDLEPEVVRAEPLLRKPLDDRLLIATLRAALGPDAGR